MGNGANFKELEKLRKQLEKLNAEQLQTFNEKSIKELAARLLAKVIERTLPGIYDKKSGKKGGTLRRGWTSKTADEARAGSGDGVDARDYAEAVEVKKVGNVYQIEIINPVEYASYVEYGHRKRNGGWVEEKLMLTISETELRENAPKILQRKLDKFLGDAFK